MILRLKRIRKAKDILKVIEPAFKDGLEYAVGVVQTKYLSGPRPKKLGVRTGHLRSSIRPYVEREDGKLIGKVGSYGVKYARIHELGGVILPKKASALRFQVEPGRWVTVKKVIMPKRPYLRPGVKDSLGRIRTLIKRRLQEQGVLN